MSQAVYMKALAHHRTAMTLPLPFYLPSVPSPGWISPDIFFHIAALDLLPILDIIPEITPLRSHLGQFPSYALLISYTTPISTQTKAESPQCFDTGTSS
jgi:hypothetical protein